MMTNDPASYCNRRINSPKKTEKCLNMPSVVHQQTGVVHIAFLD